MFDDEVERICEVDPVTGHVNQSYQLYIIYPANGYATSMDIINHAADTIQEELDERLAYFDEQGKPLEKERLEQRCRYDIEALREFGVCPGVISMTSPRTLKVPLNGSVSLRLYC